MNLTIMGSVNSYTKTMKLRSEERRVGKEC